MKRNVILLAGLLVLALPVFADDDDNEPGFFIGVEARSLQPSGLPTDFVLVDPDDDGTPEGTIESVDFSSEISPRVFFGWSKENGSRWALSWWEYDEDETASASATFPAELWDILYHPDASFEDYQGTANALAAVEATVIDLTYSRPAFSNDNFHARWMAGIRQASLDYGLGVVYADDNVPANTEDLILISEADGIGFTGGFSGAIVLSDQWFVAGGAQYSFLTGEVEASTLMFDSFSGITDPNVNVQGEEDRVIGMFDVSCAIVWHPAEKWYIWAGYEFSHWTNAVDTHLFPDDVHEGFVQTDTSDVTWDGFTVGAGVRF